jgi:predicted anti-sigma-YlaC factor YlaD
MMNCKQASQLISRKLDEKLSKRERFALKMHLFLCKYCSRFSQQLSTLQIAISKLGKDIEDDSNITLPTETKQKIMHSLESED